MNVSIAGFAITMGPRINAKVLRATPKVKDLLGPRNKTPNTGKTETTL